jgi:hypothetical protein
LTGRLQSAAAVAEASTTLNEMQRKKFGKLPKALITRHSLARVCLLFCVSQQQKVTVFPVFSENRRNSVVCE